MGKEIKAKWGRFIVFPVLWLLAHGDAALQDSATSFFTFGIQEGWKGVLFGKTPHIVTEGGANVWGIDARFGANLPFLMPEILEFKACFRRYLQGSYF